MTKRFNSLNYFFAIFILLTSFSVVRFYPEYGQKFSEKTDNNLSGLKAEQNSPPFIVGVMNGPHTLDPIDTWDSASYDVIVQVCEGLFQYNLSDHTMPRVNHLAESYWWQDVTTLQIKLREGIFFHDMYPFNSTAAVWNFNRILYFTNSSGTLPGTQHLAQPSSLYYFPDSITPIINSVTAIGEYNITIILNGAYSPLLDLLSFTSSYMVSPSSTPASDYIDLSTGDLVGTGPFVYNGYTPNVEVNFIAFDTYWQGKADINDMIFLVLSDSVTRNNAMLNHDIDYLQGPIANLIQIFETDPSITVMKYTETYGIPSLAYQYLGMNNDIITLPWRKAISYAINYTYIIEELMSGLAVRSNSPISPGFGDSYNFSVTAADYDLTNARQILVDEGIAVGYPVNSDPNDAYWLANPIITFNYTYNVGNPFREDIFDALNVWLPSIGIQVIENGVTWDTFLRKLFVDHDELELFWVGWGPDYLDPFNMLDPLFNPTSYANSAQVNDVKLNVMMNVALLTTDDMSRNNIYKNIQSYLAERLYPHCFGCNSKITYVYSANLTNYPHNALNLLYFYPCKWIHLSVDLVPPIITIIEPNNGDEFTTSIPIYEIEIIEPNLDDVWYTVDGGTTNNTITSLIGIIDETVWNDLSYGVVMITFYANDTEGNIGYASVLVYKNEPITPLPEIPGFNPILILGILSIGIIGLIWQFKNKKFK